VNSLKDINHQLIKNKMTTKPPSGIAYFSDEEQIKKIYNITESLSEIIPVTNERYRLAYCLDLYINGKSTDLLDSIDQARPTSSTKDFPELEKIIKQKLTESNLIK